MCERCGMWFRVLPVAGGCFGVVKHGADLVPVKLDEFPSELDAMMFALALHVDRLNVLAEHGRCAL